MPNLALRKLILVTTLILDANLFHSLETGCIHDINVKFLSISHCKLLDRLDQSSIANLPNVETITLNNNPSLAYFHPGSNVPNLVTGHSPPGQQQPVLFKGYSAIHPFHEESIPVRQHVPMPL